MNYRHGMAHTRLDHIYKHMKSRCTNPNDIGYKDYGGRGIVVCEEWLADKTKFFEWSLKNGYSDNLTIDRINNDKGYSPDNCRWTSFNVQANNKRNSAYIECNGAKKTYSQWAEETGIKKATLWARINVYGWSVEKAITWGQNDGRKSR